MHGARAFTACALVCALAGCASPLEDREAGVRLNGTGPAQNEVAADWFERALPHDASHNHDDPEQHQNLSTPNFKILGHDPLITDYHGRSSGGYGCSSTVERDGRRLSVAQSYDTDVAFVMSDVTDPAAPQKIGELVLESAQSYDVALTTDLRYVLVSTSPFDLGPDAIAPPTPAVVFHDACDGTSRVLDGPESGLPYAAGIVLVDVENPRNPIVVDFFPTPIWGHSVRTSNIGGRELITVTVISLEYSASYYVFMEIAQTPAGPKLVPLSTYQFPEPAQHASVRGWGHDGLIAQHPVTGKTLAYLAYGTVGFVILDMEDVRNPGLLSVYRDWSMLDIGTPSVYIHGAIPLRGTLDGRHYTFLGDECAARTPKIPTCLAVVIDTTDPAKPVFESAWTFPVDVQWDRPFRFSMHYLDEQDGILFVTTYHGGVWAIDLRTPEARRAARSIGVFIPAEESPKPSSNGTSIMLRTFFKVYSGDFAVEGTPTVWDVEPIGEHRLVIYDYKTGLYTVEFDPEQPMPAPPPWPLGYSLET